MMTTSLADHDAFQKGLTFLSQAYGIEVRDYLELQKADPVLEAKPGAFLWHEDRNPDVWGSDTSSGPSTHAVSWRRKILWLDTRSSLHAEWLHEVSHLVVSPPWEQHGPDSSNEMAALFTWEHQVAHDLHRRKLWTAEDLQQFLGFQAIYVATNDGYEWADTTQASRRRFFAHTRKTLRAAGLLDARNRPTFQPPQWTDEVKARWESHDDLLIGKRR